MELRDNLKKLEDRTKEVTQKRTKVAFKGCEWLRRSNLNKCRIPQEDNRENEKYANMGDIFEFVRIRNK